MKSQNIIFLPAFSVISFLKVLSFYSQVEAERKIAEDETSPQAKASEVSMTKKAEVTPDEPSASAQVCSEGQFFAYIYHFK